MAEEEEIPKLPRGRGLKLSGPEIFRILITLGLLIAIVVLAKPCGDAVGNFVMRFDKGSAGSAMPRPGTLDVPAGSAGSDAYIHFKGMTDDQIKEAIERERARHAGSAGVGSDR